MRAAEPVPASTDIFVTDATSKRRPAYTGTAPGLKDSIRPVPAAAPLSSQGRAAAANATPGQPVVVSSGTGLGRGGQLQGVALNGNGKVGSVSRG